MKLIVDTPLANMESINGISYEFRSFETFKLLCFNHVE